MKAFLDSSVLVAAFYADHLHHEPSLALLSECNRKEAGCAAHSLLEVYSVLTRLPGRIKVKPEYALLFLEDVIERVSVISLNADESIQLLKTLSKEGISGGAVYDALIAQCALKAGAKAIFTWNVRQWQQLGKEVAQRLKTP